MQSLSNLTLLTAGHQLIMIIVKVSHVELQPPPKMACVCLQVQQSMSLLIRLSLFVLQRATSFLLFCRVACSPSPFADCFRIVHGNDKQQQCPSALDALLLFSLLLLIVVPSDPRVSVSVHWNTRSISGIINVPLPNRVVTLLAPTV